MRKLYIVSLMFLSLAGLLTSGCGDDEAAKKAAVESEQAAAAAKATWKDVSLTKGAVKFDAKTDKIDNDASRKINGGLAVVATGKDADGKDVEYPNKLFIVSGNDVVAAIDSLVTNGQENGLPKKWTPINLQVVKLKANGTEYLMFRADDKGWRTLGLDKSADMLLGLKDGKLAPFGGDLAKDYDVVQKVDAGKGVAKLASEVQGLPEDFDKTQKLVQFGNDAEGYLVVKSQKVYHRNTK